ncbi:putative drug exporter of the RND superfamily [Nocardioides terrae]|uniref:Putative drug exporter of the RND superfamily n=1 Tax=Nocardioides terrae TaxID=574651 RepID=A0A1I1G9L4_9ACTN|nr:MMPL family transporter [Nocardioides terrae]SFC08076.1 putative drug exporter of the RND superfamily [Nocardioides terrae]
MSARNRDGIPLRIARWCASHPWRAIGGWLAFVAVAVALAAAIPSQQTTDADYDTGDSGRAAALVRGADLDAPDTESILITGGTPAERSAAAGELAGRATGLSFVTRLADPVTSPDGKAVIVNAELRDDTDDVDGLQKATDAVQKAHPALDIRETGDVTINDAINERVGDDLSSAEGISLPITLILMLLAFGALIAAGIPVLVGATSVAATIGLSAPISHLVHAEPTVSSLIVLIGMAVGVDYSLFFLKRARAERDAGRSTLDAVEIAAATSGHSILVSGAAVIASMAGLYLVGDVTFNSLATGAIVVVAVAVIGSITVLPALLGGLGRWVDRPRIPLLWRLNRRLGRGGISTRLLAPVVRHPVAALLAGGLVVLALSAPALGMKIHQSNLATLPQSIPQVQTYRDMEAAFPSQQLGADVVAPIRHGQERQVRAALTELQAAASETPDFLPGTPDIRVAEDGSVALLHLTMRYTDDDPRVDDAVLNLRDRLVPAAMGHRTAYVGGSAAADHDTTQVLNDRLPLVVGVVLLLTVLVMGLAFRSLVLALVTSVLNLASVGVAFGVLTLVFQHGFLEGPLGFESPGFIINWLPLFVMVILVGLSMDYHAFVLSRVREHALNGLPPRLAVSRGIADTSGVVTSAAAVMVSVFAIFATLSMLEMKTMGVGLAVAILLDATLVRQVLLPAALVLLGEKVWWPGRIAAPAGTPVEEPEPAYAL